MFKNFATLAVTAMAGAFTPVVHDNDHWSIHKREATHNDQLVADLFLSDLEATLHLN